MNFTPRFALVFDNAWWTLHRLKDKNSKEIPDMFDCMHNAVVNCLSAEGMRKVSTDCIYENQSKEDFDTVLPEVKSAILEAFSGQWQDFGTDEVSLLVKEPGKDWTEHVFAYDMSEWIPSLTEIEWRSSTLKDQLADSDIPLAVSCTAKYFTTPGEELGCITRSEFAAMRDEYTVNINPYSERFTDQDMVYLSRLYAAPWGSCPALSGDPRDFAAVFAAAVDLTSELEWKRSRNFFNSPESADDAYRNVFSRLKAESDRICPGADLAGFDGGIHLKRMIFNGLFLNSALKNCEIAVKKRNLPYDPLENADQLAVRVPASLLYMQGAVFESAISDPALRFFDKAAVSGWDAANFAEVLFKKRLIVKMAGMKLSESPEISRSRGGSGRS